MGRWQQTHHGATGRGPARPRRASQAIAVAVTAALVAAGFAGVPAAAGTPAAAVSGFVSGSGGDPTALPWAGGGGSGTGPVHPDQAFAVVTQDTGLATSTTPTLRASSTAPGEYQFTIGDLATGAPVGQFGLSASGPSVRVPAGKLTDGTAYQWSVTAPDGSVAGPFVFRVDTARAGRQATDAAAGVTVALATGAVQTGWTSQKVSSAAGDLSIGLAYDPAHPATPGLPDGWTLSAGSASPYTSLTVQPGGAVDLHQVDGATVTYQAAIGQSYQPVWGTGRQAPTGALSTLAHNADNTWTITDPGGTTTLFAAADAQPGTPATAGITAVSGTGGLGFGQTWTNGRLTTITDPASGRQVTLQYGPGSAQPDGFVAAPDGMLSGVTFWDGTHARVLYVPGPGGTVQIGRLIADSDAGAAASVTDYGWDYAGRLSVLRAPAAASVLAAGLPGYSDVSTHLGYDDQGRVTAVQAPAAGPGTSAVTRHYAYAATPAADGTLTTTITQDGATPPAGFVERVATDPVTLLPATTWDADGRKATTTWDPATDHELVTTAADGGVTTDTYDPATGLLTSVVGPSRGPVDGSTPTLTYGYDQTTTGQSATSAGTTKPIKGLLSQYWADATWTGAPARTEIGPQVGGTAVDALAVNWTDSPVPADNGWSARMTGVWQVDTAGSYTVTAGPSGAAQLWIDGVDCPDGTCSGVTLTAGPHHVRVDLAVPHPTAGAAGSVSLAAAPTGQQPTPIPLDHLHPGSGRQTSTSTHDALDSTSATTLTGTATYADPQIADATALTSASGLTGTRTYEDVDPAKGQFGRETALTSPAGDTVALGYWGATESATAPGTSTAVPQAGLAKTVTDPARDGSGAGTVTSSTYYDAAGRIDAVVTATATVTTAYDAAGRPTTVTTTPTGAAQPTSVLTTQYGYQGNPLQVATTSTVRHEDGSTDTRTSVVAVDLGGRTVLTQDGWGTTSATSYDAVTGKPATTTTTTAPTDGAAPTVKTTTNHYNPDGALHDTAVTTGSSGAASSTVTAALTWAANGDLQSVTTGTGVTTTFTTDSHGRTTAAGTTTADHQTFTDGRSLSPAGRVLTETLATPVHQAAYGYRYDSDQRLVNATLTTDQTVSHTGWAYTYDADSNRTGQTVTDPDGHTVSYGYTYDPAGSRLTATTDPNIGALVYDQITGADLTGLGGTTLAYDADHQVVTTAAGGTATTYQRDAAETVVARTVTPTGSAATTERFSLDGLTLDEHNHLAQDGTTLPGGFTVTTPATGAPIWTVADLGGAAWFTLTAAGTPTGTPALYDPFGQLLTGIAAAGGPDLPGWGVGMTAVPVTAGPVVLLDGARVYVPALGRFTTLDPTVGGSANPYDYANQDPIGTVDPTGQDALADVVGTIVGTLVTGALLLASALGGPEIGASSVAAGRATATVVSRALLRFMIGSRRLGTIITGVMAGAGLGVVGAASGDAATQLTHQLTETSPGWSWSEFDHAVATGAAVGAVLGLAAGPASAKAVNDLFRSTRRAALPALPRFFRAGPISLMRQAART